MVARAAAARALLTIDRAAILPDVRREHVRFEDDDIVVIDKPAGVPSQAIEKDRGDDIVARVSRHLGGAALGVHQRLDRDTSGVMVLAKSKEANAWLAHAFERRTIEKVYRAIVVGRPPDGTLREGIVRGEGGAMRVVPASEARPEDVAITHVRTIERAGERALVEARIETGRTHQIRAQLAHHGAPIAGDRRYGGAPAPRLMLHSSRLVMPAPAGAIVVEADIPPAMRAFFALGEPLVRLEPAPLDEALERAMQSRFALMRAPDTTAFRLVHDGDAIPGLAVDVYGDHLVAHFYDDAPRGEVLDALDRLGFSGVYLKLRPKQANELDDEARLMLAPPSALRGRDAPATFEVLEHGVAYEVALGEGLSCGLYLDQRENRARVAALCAGKSLLNLFAYTCGFSAAAAARGAARTVSVDTSARALARGERNVKRASSSGDHRFYKDDAFEHLARATRRGDRYDVVVLDPPTYASAGKGARKHRFRSGRDWVELAASAMRLVDRDGSLLASSNDERMSGTAFRRFLHEAARSAKRGVVQMKDLPDPVDFPPAFGREPHLKAALVRLD